MNGMGNVGCIALMVVAFVIVAIISGIQTFLSALFGSYLLYISIAIIIGGELLGKYQKNHPYSKNGLYVAGAAFLIVVGGYFYNSFFSSSTNSVASHFSQTKTSQTNYVLDAKTKKELENQLNQYGIPAATVLASTYGHSKDGYLNVVNADGENFITIIDEKAGYAALAIPLTPIEKILEEAGGGKMAVVLAFPKDDPKVDANLGDWNGSMHMLPVVCQYAHSKYGDLQSDLVMGPAVYSVDITQPHPPLEEEDKNPERALIKLANKEVTSEKNINMVRLYINNLDALAHAMRENNLDLSSLTTGDNFLGKNVQGSGQKTGSQESIIKEETPEAVFQTYHQFITNRQYQNAYNLLTPAFQAAMGDCQSWSQGYATTVSSTPDQIRVSTNDGSRAVLSFRLKAVDRVGATEKTQYFRGTCTLLKLNGHWLIDEITAEQA